MEKIKVGVVGATGYAGAEICRLIAGHPAAELAAISSVSFEGRALSDVYPAYREMCDLICTTQEAVVEKSDVIFAALPHGLSQELAAECDKKGKAFIDLGADFRLKSEEEYTEWYGGTFADKALHEKAVYGLPELFREEIKKTKLVANPGCYTTAVPLALVPALEKGYIETTGIIANCASGVTGAGRKPAQNSHYPELNEGMSAYKVACHRPYARKSNRRFPKFRVRKCTSRSCRICCGEPRHFSDMLCKTQAGRYGGNASRGV